MAQAGYTPIQLYLSTTASAVPSAGNLANGELAINITDGKLFYKDNGGVVQVLATKGAGTIGGSNTQVQYNSSGALAGSANLTFDGTTLTANALTVSNAVTLSGGTANGVAYLNGSKVLTTGSALTFDSQNLGLGTASPRVLSGFTTFAINNTGVNGGLIDLMQAGTVYGSLYLSKANNKVALSGATGIDLAFEANNSEQMRLTSTGLGIGTSSPVGRLTIQGAAGTSGINQGIGLLYSNGTQYGALGLNNSTGWPQLMARAGAGLTFHVNSDLVTTGEAMRLDPSGNLGLGVTPSASQIPQLQISRGAFTGDINSSYVSNNWYYNGGDKYIGTNYALQYKQAAINGQHQWFTAPSGTAGNAISFTQAMTLDASGNLSVGTTSVKQRLTVGGGISAIDNVVAASTGSLGVAIGTAGSATGTADLAYIVSDNGAYGGYNDLIISPRNNTGAVGNLRIYTGGSERARIDSSGNLLVGITTSSDAPAHGVRISDFSGTLGVISIGHASSVGSGNYYATFAYNSGIIGSITQNGTTAVAYNTSSDYRLKENIQPMTGALAKVAALKPCTYKWKADGSDGEGFIAHELAEVVPQAVTGEKDAVDAEGKPIYQGIDTSFLAGLYAAAIQELKASLDEVKLEFDAYKAAHP